MVPTREEEIESIERSERGGGEYCIYSLYISSQVFNPKINTNIEPNYKQKWREHLFHLDL